jgi:hypothetical protein
VVLYLEPVAQSLRGIALAQPVAMPHLPESRHVQVPNALCLASPTSHDNATRG